MKSSQFHDAEVDRLVRAQSPLIRDAIARPEVSQLLDALGEEIPVRPREGSARRWRMSITRPRGVLLAGAVMACLAGGAAAARFLTAHTGQYPARAWEVQAGGPGEYLRSSAPDFCRVALGISSDLRYPPGYESWRSYVLLVEDGIRRVGLSGPCGSPGGSGRTASTGAVHGWFAASAFCAWAWDWRQARLSDDPAAAARAARVIGGALHWKAIRAEGPHAQGRDQRQPSPFGWMLAYQAAVRAGDFGRIPRLANQSGFGDCGMFHPGMQGGPRWVTAGGGTYRAVG